MGKLLHLGGVTGRMRRILHGLVDHESVRKNLTGEVLEMHEHLEGALIKMRLFVPEDVLTSDLKRTLTAFAAERGLVLDVVSYQPLLSRGLK